MTEKSKHVFAQPFPVYDHIDRNARIYENLLNWCPKRIGEEKKGGGFNSFSNNASDVIICIFQEKYDERSIINQTFHRNIRLWLAQRLYRLWDKHS